MNIRTCFDLCKVLFLVSILTEGILGRPHKHFRRKDDKIVKRVEISDAGRFKAEVPVRRQNVIHAGDDYESTTDDSKSAPDELENLGRIVDYDGKVIESNKPSGSKWKDTTGISKDVIAKIKEIQDSLIKRSGGAKLAEKLQELQPEKNITVASTDSNGVTSRKVIPEDVVNKIILKFQELRTQAQELAKLDQRKKNEAAESGETKEMKENKEEKSDEKSNEKSTEKSSEKSNEKSQAESEKKTKDVESREQKPSKPLSPYESIGPAKDNDEVRNITRNSISEQQGKLPGNQEIYKATTAGAVPPQSTADAHGFMQNNMRQPNNAMFQQNNNNMLQNMQPPNMQPQNMQENMPGNMMMMPRPGGKVPMMFIKSGQMLVPVFGGQNGPTYGNPNGAGFSDRGDVDGRSQAPFMPTPEMMMPPVPQAPMIETGQSRSVPPTMNNAPNGVNIPSVPYSMIMSLMNGPKMLTNLPASPYVPPQMNGGVFNMPQNQGMNGAGFMQQGPLGPVSGPPNGDMPGSARSIDGQGWEGMRGQGMGEQGMGGQGMEGQGMGGQETSAFTGGFAGQGQGFAGQGQGFAGQGQGFPGQGFPGQGSPMGGPGQSMGGLGSAAAMDLNGKVSMVNPMRPNDSPASAAFLPQQAFGPMSQNPFQNQNPQNGMEIFDKNRQMLNPVMQNPVNDLSDPEGPGQANLRNVNPDSLLELAKMKSTETDNPDIGDARSLPRDPDTLLDTLHSRQLSRGLTGPGDPERFAMNGLNGMMAPAPSHSPFDGTNPETLLDMLSKRKSNANNNNKDIMEWEHAQEKKLFNNLKSENNAFGRGQISEIGTNGMQSVSSIPVPGPGNIDPSFADVVGNQPFDIASRNSAGDNPVESSFFRPNHNNVGPNSISVMSHDDLRYEHSKTAIDSGEGIGTFNQADIYARHKIMNPDQVGSKRSKTGSLHDDNVELRVNGKPLAEKGSLRSKIVDGKIQKGHGKILTSKSPVKIELSHSDDAKKTKVVNIITTGKFDLKESRRDKITKKGETTTGDKRKLIKKFYKGS